MVTDKELAVFARSVVDAAMATDFKIDPLIGPSLSQAWGAVQSVICRHGLAIQQVIAAHLDADERFEVLRDHPTPLTAASVELVRSATDRDVLRFVTLPDDGPIDHVTRFDLLVVHLERGWVGVFDVKRGLGATASHKRKSISKDLLAARLTLPAYARTLGYAQARVATSAVIDHFGRAGFEADLTMDRKDLDRLFEGRISKRIDAMTMALGEALHAALPGLFQDAKRAGEVIELFGARPPTKRGPSR